MNFNKIHLSLFIVLLIALMSASTATDVNDTTEIISHTVVKDTTTDSMLNNEINKDNTKYEKINHNTYNNDIETNEDISKKTTNGTKSSQNNKITVNSDNFNQYFTTENTTMLLKDELLSSNDNIEMDIHDIPENINYFNINCNKTEYNDINLNITTTNNLVLTNFRVDISGFNTVKIENIKFIYTKEYIDESYVSAEKSELFILNNVSIDAERNSSSVGYAVPLYINTKAVIENSTIDAKLMETMIDWYSGLSVPNQFGVLITAPDVVFNSNKVNVIVKGALNESWYSMYGVFCGGNNLTFTNNNLSISNATGYAYGLVIRSSNNLVSNNRLIISSVSYANGIDLESGDFMNNMVKDNYINVTSGSRTAPWGNEAVAYGALILDYGYQGGIINAEKIHVRNNTYANNTIVGYGRQIYGIEIYGGKNTNLLDNNINISGRYSMGIGVVGAYVNISNNNIISTGKVNASGPSADYLKPYTSGIYIYMSVDGININNNTLDIYKGRGVLFEQSNNVNVENNLIFVEEHDNTIELGGSNHTVTCNTLYSRNAMGEDTITGKENSTVYNNGPIDTQISIDTPENIYANQDNPITITLTDINTNKLNNQEIILNIDEQDITLTTDENGTVIYNYNPKQAGTITITTVFEDTRLYTKTTQTTTIHVKTVNNTTPINQTNTTIPTNNTTPTNNTAPVNNTNPANNTNTTNNNTNNTVVVKTTPTLTVKLSNTKVYTGSKVTVTATLKDKNNKAITNQDVTITIGSTSYNQKTNTNGTISITYTTSTTGTVAVNSKYNGNALYNTASATSSFTVQPKVKTTITTNYNTDTIIGNTEKITFTLKDANNKAVANQNINITIGNTKYTQKTNTNGTITIAYKITGTSTKITAAYTGNSQYLNTTTTKTMTSQKRSTTITLSVNNTKAYITDTVKATITLKDYTGTLLKNQDIKVQIGSNSYNKKTNSKGTVTLTYKATASTKITIKYNGDATYQAKSLTKTYKASKKNTQLTLNTIKTTMYKDNVTITGKLTDKNGNIIKQAKVQLKINTKTVTVKSNSKGVFTYTTKTTLTGKNTVTATYGGDTTYNKATLNSKFTVTKRTTKMTVSKIANVKSGKKVKVTGKLTDKTGIQLRNCKIIIKLDGKTTSVQTNSKGIYSYIYTTKAKGTKKVQINYKGNANYKATSKTTTFKVTA